LGSFWFDRGDLLAVLALVAATVAFFWPMIRPFGSRMYVVDGDFSRQFFPYRAFAAQEWRSERIPLWNPDMFAGHPFQADPQTGVFYPIAWLDAVLLGRHGLPFAALEGEIVVHTFLAALFTYLLARKLTGSRAGALVAGLAFGFGGFITSYPAQQLAVLETAIWLPLIVLLIELAVTPPIRWPWLAGASAAFGVALLAGHTQTALFILYATEGYLLWRLVRQRVAWRPAALALAGFPLLAVGLAAIQVLPAARFVEVSTRATMDFATAAHGYLPSALWEVFVPLWHGEKALSVGVAALSLAVVGAIAARREPLAYWIGVGLVAIPLSTGGATPLFWILYNIAPGWNLFKDQERVIYLFSFAAALLAARGVAALQRAPLAPRLWRVSLVAVGLAALLALVFDVLGPSLGETPLLQQNLALDAAVLTVLFVLIVGAWRTRKASAGVGLAIVGLVLIEAFAINFGNNLGPTSPDARPRLAATATFMKQIGEPFRFRGISEDVFPSNYGALLGTPTIGGDSPIVAQRINEMLNSDADWRLWQILNVKFFVSNGGPLAGLTLVYHDGALNTYSMSDSLPRAWAVTADEVAHSPAEAKQMILAPGYHPGRIVVLEKEPSLGPIVAGPRPDVHLMALDAQRITIDATAAQNSMLVLANQYYPDWQAFRDGQSVPIFQANYVAMAFELPAGAHHFEIVYRPTTFYVGAAISIATLVLGLLIIFRDTILGARASRPRDTGRGEDRAPSGDELVLSARERSNPLTFFPLHVTSPLLARAVFPFAATMLLALAFALRIHDLGVPNLSADEWFMLRNHDEGPLWIIRQARIFEPHPLIYYLSLAGWIEIAGRTEFAMRFPSVGYGVVLVAALIGLGRILVNRWAGLIAGALGALNPYQIFESQNARNYEMAAAASALATLLFMRALRTGRGRDWAIYAAGMLVALNVHYDALLVFGAHVAYVVARWAWQLFRPRSRASADHRLNLLPLDRGWLVSSAIITVVTALWLVYAAPALIAYHGYFPTPVGIDVVLARSLATFSLGGTAAIPTALPISALAGLGVIWLAVERSGWALFLGLYIFLPIGAVSLLFLKRPMFDERYLIVLAPGFIVAVALAIQRLLARVWPIGIVAGLGALALTASAIGGAYAQPLKDRGDYRAMARWIGAYGKPDDPIIATGQGQANLLGYYYHGPHPIQVIDDPARIAEAIPALLDQHAGLWLVPYYHNRADDAAFALLDNLAAPVADRWFVTLHSLYYASAQGLTPAEGASSRFGDTLQLTSAAASGGTLLPGEAIDVQLNLEVTAATQTPKLSLRLLDANGTAGQSDLPIAGQPALSVGSLTTRSGVFIPLATPPGTYSVAALLYRPDSGQALPVSTSLPRVGDAVVVGKVNVAERQGPIPVEESGVALTAPRPFPDGVSVVGFDPVPASLDVGSNLSFRVLWRADQSGLPNLARTVEVTNPSGQVVAAAAGQILPNHPTTTWNAGEVYSEKLQLAIPAATASGTYHVRLRVGASSIVADLGQLNVIGPNRTFAAPRPTEAINAQFGEFATLLGDGAVAASSRGGTVSITLDWAARGTADRSYTAFVHLVDPTGQIQAQVDQLPGGGTRSTNGWLAGEYIADSYSLAVPRSAPAGQYQIEVGLYDATTGARLPVTIANGQTSDHLILATVAVS
jgi:hypothetical protein